MPTDESSRRMGARLSSRLLVGFSIGLIVGLVVGAIVGSIVSSPDDLGFWLSVVGCTIFSAGIATLVAGYSSLESPDPGAEPSDTQDPITDRPGLTREENGPDDRSG